MSGVQASGAGAALPHQQHQQQNATFVQFSDEAVAKIIKAYADHKEEEEADLRGYTMVLATLTASITYTAALTPPGGFWGANDMDHVAGTPIFKDNFPNRYRVFYYCNLTSFASSLYIIVMLANKKLSRLTKPALFSLLVMDGLGLAGAITAGSSTVVRTSVYGITLMLFVMVLIIMRLSVNVLNRNWVV